MSAVIVLAPIVAWQLFAAAAAAIAAHQGLKVMAQTEQTTQGKTATPTLGETEWEIREATKLGETLAQDEEFTLEKDGAKLTFRKTAKGRIKVCVAGMGKTKEKLRETGQKVINQIMQQYSYKQATEEMKRRGFQITEEQTLEDGSIRLQVRRWA